MTLSVGTRVVTQAPRGPHSEFGHRGIVLDIDRDAGCCRVALDENPEVPVKLAIRHLAPDLESFVTTARFAQDKIDLRTDQALAEAIEACAQATSSLCSSTVREVSRTRRDQDAALKEELSRRLTRLEQRMEDIDHALRSDRQDAANWKESPLPREKRKEALFQAEKEENQKMVKDLKFQLDQQLSHLASQVEDVAKNQTELQHFVKTLASQVQRPDSAADYEMALRKLTSNMEDIRSMIASPLLSPRRGASPASSPLPQGPATISTAHVPRPWPEPAQPSPGASCPHCGTLYAADSKFCRRCGQRRQVAAAVVGTAASPAIGTATRVATAAASPRSFSWHMK